MTVSRTDADDADTDAGTADQAVDPATNPATNPATDQAADRVAGTVERARAWLLAAQTPGGWWQGRLQSNVTIEAEDLLLREFLGIRSADDTEQTARWIRGLQRDDGSWATFHGGPGDLSTTVEAWVALRLAGDDPSSEHLQRAAQFVLAEGGVGRSRVFTRIWLALFGLWSWDELPCLPPELILLPSWFPLNICDWACWARQTIVPLTLVATQRPCRPLPFGIDELVIAGHDRTGGVTGDSGREGAGNGPGERRCSSPAVARRSRMPGKRSHLISWAGVFEQLDVVLHAYSRRPVKWLRRLAVRRAEHWILQRQEADGSWGGIQPPWVYSILALHLGGYPLDHPVLKAAIEGLESYVVRERADHGGVADQGDPAAAAEQVRWLEACQSPVWDTALAVIALLDSGSAPGDEAVTRAAGWLLTQEIRRPGDWAVRRPDLASGGWAFEFANDNYPDIDDTAEVVLALMRGGDDQAGPTSGAVARGLAWAGGMQGRDGGWAAFDADNTRKLATHLPFCDFGAVIDPPSADVTAHVVEMLAAAGQAGDERCRRGVRWLLEAQEDDGSWFGRWGANHVYGTGAAVPALVAAGVAASDPVVRRAVAWLEQHQNPDGGWGEDLRSYRDRTLAGIGATTPSQTAWALLALLAAGEERSAVVEDGVGWLIRAQRADGGWDEPEFTGTGFPGDFYLAYHLYRQVFPLSALGRYLKATARQAVSW